MSITDMSKEKQLSLKVFSNREYRTLKAVVDTMVPEAEAVSGIDLAASIDRVLSGVRKQLKDEFKLLLYIVEYGPPLLGLRFKFLSQMTAEERKDYLARWECSRLAIKRMGFQALKRSALAAYYGAEESWARIHYRGPWLNAGYPHDYEGREIQFRE